MADSSPAAGRDRVVIPARRPAALVVPLALVTEIGGVLCIRAGASIGWFIVAAPVVGLLSTALVMRPTLELTADGVVQRQYPFSSLTRWDVIEALALVRAGNRPVLASRLRDGIPPPRRQPAAALLRAAELPWDGGWFADALRGRPEETLATVERYLRSPELRAGLVPATR